MLLERLSRYLSVEEEQRIFAQAAASRRRLDLQAAGPLCRALVLETSTRVNIGGSGEIPRHVVQFWDDKRIPLDVLACIETWQSVEGFEYRRFDDDGARKFIAAEFGDEIAEAYSLCGHPAMKSDVFRFAYLFRNGGVYVDADNAYSGNGLADLIRKCGALNVQPLCRDQTPPGCNISPWKAPAEHLATGRLLFSLTTDPILAAPGHPALLKALQRATRLLLEAKRNGQTCNKVSWTTGPDNLTIAIYDALLDAIAAGRDFDVQLISNWSEIGPRKSFLEYRGTAKDWRTFIRPPAMDATVC